MLFVPPSSTQGLPLELFSAYFYQDSLCIRKADLPSAPLSAFPFSAQVTLQLVSVELSKRAQSDCLDTCCSAK